MSIVGRRLPDTRFGELPEALDDLRPGDGSSNSILHSGGATHVTWHGYVEHNVWTEC